MDEEDLTPIGEAHLLVEVMEGAVLAGKIPFDGIDWRHTRSLSFQEWADRVGLHKPDYAKILENEVCAECGVVIPRVVFAYKDDHIIDSWGGVLMGGIICDECSPL